MNFSPYLLDVLDILIVAFIFYRLFLLIKGSRAYEMLLGLLLVIVASFVAQWLRLNALMWIISSLQAVWVIAFVIIFQPELRKALAQIGHRSVGNLLYHMSPTVIFDEIISAVEKLSDKGYGAIIVLERSTDLTPYIQTGKEMQSTISAELLVTLFTPNTPLHDGAVIIRRNNIVAASCILPLTLREDLPPEMGTRHRAGIGLTEETDAVVIIVSEETSIISIAVEGKIIRNLDSISLKELLANYFAQS